MRYNHIQRFMTVALLLAFTAPAGISYPTYGGYNSYSGGDAYPAGATTDLSTNVKLSDKNEKITLSLRDSDVKQVLRMFADKAGKNVVFHSSVKGNITLDLVDMPINDAFALVLQISNLSYYIKDNTLIVLSKASNDNAAFSRQEMMVFPVQYVSAAKIAEFLNKNVFGMKKAGMSGGDAATVNAATNEVIVFGMPSDAAIVRNVIAQLDKEPLTKTFIVNHTTPAEMADMICNMLLPAHGTGESSGSGSGKKTDYVPPTPGIGTGLAASITGGAASTGSSELVKLGEGVVACSVSQNAPGAISGFDVQNLAISYYPQRGSIMLMGGSEAQARMIEEFIKTNDIRQPQAYLEVSILELNEEGSKEFQNNWSFGTGTWAFSYAKGLTTGGRSGAGGILEHYMPITQYIKTPIYDDQKAQIGSVYKPYDDYMTVRQQYPGTYISWTMNYLIENKKARVLANPKIIITNGQESTIDLTEDYVEKVTSEFLSSSGVGTTGAVQKTYTIKDDKGIKISLVPFISPDGYVTLNIKPGYATEAGKVYSENEAGGKDIGATLLNRRNLDLKNVRIKDGETLVIGGMLSEGEQKTVQKIPVLGDLPLVGAAFRSTMSNKVKTEMVIMITPKIIQDGETVADRL